jgi:hypothetical protein
VADADNDIVDIEIFGLTFRAPRHEARALAARIGELEAQAAHVPVLLARLDEVERNHARVEKELFAIQRATEAAFGVLRGSR